MNECIQLFNMAFNCIPSIEPREARNWILHWERLSEYKINKMKHQIKENERVISCRRKRLYLVEVSSDS